MLWEISHLFGSQHARRHSSIYRMTSCLILSTQRTSELAEQLLSWRTPAHAQQGLIVVVVPLTLLLSML